MTTLLFPKMSSPIHSPSVTTPTQVSAYSPGKAIGFALCIILGFGGWFLLINVNQKWFAAKLLTSLRSHEAQLLKLVSGALGSVFLVIGVIGSIKNRSTYVLSSLDNEVITPPAPPNAACLLPSISPIEPVALTSPLETSAVVPTENPVVEVHVTPVLTRGADVLVADAALSSHESSPPATSLLSREVEASLSTLHSVETVASISLSSPVPKSSVPTDGSLVVARVASALPTGGTMSSSLSLEVTREPLTQTLALFAPENSPLHLSGELIKRHNPTKGLRHDPDATIKALQNPWIIFSDVHLDQFLPEFLTMDQENTERILAFPSLCRYYLPTYIYSNEVSAVKSLLSASSISRHPYLQPLLAAQHLAKSLPAATLSMYLSNLTILKNAYQLLEANEVDLYERLEDAVQPGLSMDIFHALWKEGMVVRDLRIKVGKLLGENRGSVIDIDMFFEEGSIVRLISKAQATGREDVLLFCASTFRTCRHRILRISRYNPRIGIQLAQDSLRRKCPTEYTRILRTTLELFFLQPMQLPPEEQLPIFKIIYKEIKVAGVMPENYFSDDFFYTATNLDLPWGKDPDVFYFGIIPVIDYLLSQEKPSKEALEGLLRGLQRRVSKDSAAATALQEEQNNLEAAEALSPRRHRRELLASVSDKLVRLNSRITCSQENLKLVRSYYESTFSITPRAATIPLKV